MPPLFGHPSQWEFDHLQGHFYYPPQRVHCPPQQDFHPPPQQVFELPQTNDILTFRTPTQGAGQTSLLMPPPNVSLGVPRYVGPPLMSRYAIFGRPGPGYSCDSYTESLLRQAWRECQHLAVTYGYQQPGGNQVLSDEIISAIVRSHQLPSNLLLPARSPNVDPVDNDMTIGNHDRPSRPSLLAPSPKFNPADNEILSELDFQAYRRAVVVEVMKLRKLALKRLLTDAWAVRKPFQLCQMVADKQVQAFFDNVEDHLKAGNPKFFLMHHNGGREIDEVNGERRQHLSVSLRSKPEATTLLEDSMIRQYVYLVDRLIYQMTPAAEDSSQVRQNQLLAEVNRVGMQVHLEALRQWNVEWDRQADDRVEGRNRYWHAGPVRMDVMTTEVTYSPRLEVRPSRGRMARPTPKCSRAEQQQKPKLSWRNLSKEVKDAIDKCAAQMVEKASEEDKTRIRANMDTMSIQKREILARKSIDPVFYYFRTRAMKQYRGQSSQSDGAEEGLAPNSSIGKPKDTAAGLRHKKAENQAIPNSNQAQAQPEKCGMSKPGRIRTVSGDDRLEEAAIWRQTQTIDNQEQEIGTASRKRRKIMASNTALCGPVVGLRKLGLMEGNYLSMER